jgi:hypothetical protein
MSNEDILAVRRLAARVGAPLSESISGALSLTGLSPGVPQALFTGDSDIIDSADLVWVLGPTLATAPRLLSRVREASRAAPASSRSTSMQIGETESRALLRA